MVRAPHDEQTQPPTHTGVRLFWLGVPPVPSTVARLQAAGFSPVVTSARRGPVDGTLWIVVGSADDVGLLAQDRRVLAVVPTAGDVPAALEAGACDAVVRGADDELVARLRVWTRVVRETRALAESNSQLRALALLDELTRLGNRRSFLQALEFALDYGARYGGTPSVMLADLDGMKSINDRYGHPAGDAALRTVAEVIRGSVRGVDHAARLGGDEFGVVMPATRIADAVSVAERIRDRIDTLLLPGGARLSVSVGVAALDAPGRGGATAETLIERADAALYAAKRAGKNGVQVSINGVVQAA